jgi:hypothetical protein
MVHLRILSASFLLASFLTAQGKSDKIDFEQHVLPILKTNCLECHSSGPGENGRMRRPKGGVSLDGKKGIEAGRRGKPILVAGKPDESQIFKVLSLPIDDEKHMPPAKKKEPLGKEDTETLRKWIEQGAEFGKWIGNPELPPQGRGRGGEGKGDPGADKGDDEGKGGEGKGDAKGEAKPDVFGPLAKGVKPADAKAVKAASAKATIEPVAEGSPLLKVTMKAAAADADVAALLPLKDNIAVLVLSGTAVTSAACANIAKLPRLVHLDLANTKVADAGFAKFVAPELRQLDLSKTPVTDATAKALGKLPHLATLNLVDTKVTAEAIADLKKDHPDLAVTPQGAQPASK